jgi:hypothetical protein
MSLFVNPEIKQISDNLTPAFVTAFKSFQEKTKETLSLYIDGMFDRYLEKVTNECRGIFEQEWKMQAESDLCESPGRKKLGTTKKQEVVTHRILSLQRKYFEKYLFALGEDIVKMSADLLEKRLEFRVPSNFRLFSTKMS